MGHASWSKGKELSEETKAKMSESLVKDYASGKRTPPQTGKKNEKSINWVGDKVGYRGIHHWISKELGKPRICNQCDDSELNHRQYHWANISGNYLRELTDWVRLCASCHKKYDLGKIELCHTI